MASSNDDDYVQETEGSCDEDRGRPSRSRSLGDSSDDDTAADDFFEKRAYGDRADIKRAVVEYNEKYGRGFKIVSSDHRRFKAVCVDAECEFVVGFSYGRGIGPPGRFAPHTCDPTSVDVDDHVASRARKASYLVELPEVRQFVVDNGRDSSPADLKKLLKSQGRQVTYRSCADACDRLKKSFFDSDRSQFQLMLSYVHEMNKRGHKADLELRENTVGRVVVIYRQGVQVVREYADRGFSVDGTFMRHEFGGTLLVACLLNSNREIQIVGVAWVSGENKDNWSWFLQALLKATSSPAFVMSDRDKGLLPAMEDVAPAIPHFVCLRHMMENFNAKFRNKVLRDDAWRLGKSLSVSSYNRRAEELKLKNPRALEWMEAVAATKWSAAHSPCPRFGTMTSNNVESVNSILRPARDMPLLDCFMFIEKYVGRRWVDACGQGSSWNHLTPYAKRKFIDKPLTATVDKIEIIPACSSSFIAKVRKEGQLPVEYAVDLDKRESPCSCGCFEYVKAPCAHVVAALKSVNKLSLLSSFFDDSWTAEAYRRAYDPTIKMSPYVIKDDLLRFENHQPPPVPKKRGRPKKNAKRIESQSASLALKKSGSYKCGRCKEEGHNKRSCTRE